MRISLSSWLTALCAAAVLAGCASKSQPPAPAPVESRTRPTVNAGGFVVPAPGQPARASTQAPAASTAVRTEPVRSAGVQSRPLDRPVETRPAASADQVRTQPQGLKRPYSEVAMAEMRGTPAPTAEAATAPDSVKSDAKGEAAGAAGRGDAKPDPKAEAKPGAKAETKTDARVESGGGFAWPARGKVIQGFSEPRNMGIAISGNPGDPVQAVADGRVIFSGPGPRGYGNLLIVKHDSETLSVYAHNRALLVKDGAQVKRGQQIAELGESGTDRPKLHFEIRKAGRPVDPLKLLPPR